MSYSIFDGDIADDDEARKQIANAGRLRCERSGYGSRVQFTKMLEEVMRYKKTRQKEFKKRRCKEISNNTF